MDILNLIVGLFMIGIGFLVKSIPDLFNYLWIFPFKENLW